MMFGSGLKLTALPFGSSRFISVRKVKVVVKKKGVAKKWGKPRGSPGEAQAT
jgi:hypothetical protein